MKSFKWAALLLLVTVVDRSAQAQLADQGLRQLRSLHWTQASGLQLATSHSSLRNLPNFVAVIGADATKARLIEDGVTDTGAEAEILNTKDGKEAVFEYNPVGFVASKDWSNVNADDMLQQVRDNTENSNGSRRLQGLAELHVTGWLQQPTLNPETHMVSWIISATRSSGDSIINAVALKLGRYGYERITLVDDAINSPSAVQNLLFIANEHQFDFGARYNEYIVGSDRSAEYGVAGLVAGALGVKLLKVAGGIGFLVLVKKAGWLALLPFFWLWGLMKGKRIELTLSSSGDKQERGIEPLCLAKNTANKREPYLTK